MPKSPPGHGNGGEQLFPQGVASDDPTGHVIANVLEGMDLILRHSTELSAKQLDRLTGGESAEDAMATRAALVGRLRKAATRLTEIADQLER